MRATGRVVHRSQRLYIAEAELVDGDSRPIGRGSGSFMKSAIALNADVGYV
jgi:acyl-coenzyme A thioesterase PaaI-like protein